MAIRKNGFIFIVVARVMEDKVYRRAAAASTLLSIAAAVPCWSTEASRPRSRGRTRSRGLFAF
jgi:hypothetical protein